MTGSPASAFSAAPASYTSPAFSVPSSTAPRFSSPNLSRKSQQSGAPMSSPRLKRKTQPAHSEIPSLLKTGYNPPKFYTNTSTSQSSIALPKHLSNLVVNPSAHKQNDPKRLAQDLYNLGFRQVCVYWNLVGYELWVFIRLVYRIGFRPLNLSNNLCVDENFS